MKRYIYIIGIVLAAAMLHSGCMKLQTNMTYANISFKPLIGHDTRAVESVPFPQDQTFKVWAVNQTSGQTYIDGETISHSPEGWRSEKVWPQDGGLQFHAYWPTDLQMEFSPSEGLQLKDFDCSGADMDILVARAYDNNEEDDQVILTFEHILSRVEFRILHSLTEEMTVRLKKIRMMGFASRGDYNTRVPYNWNFSETDFSYVVYDSTDEQGIEVPAGEAMYVGEEFYVIPQTSLAALEVTYEVRYGVANWVPQTDVIESLNTLWEPGKHYTYTVNLRMDKLTHTTGISSIQNRE